ncbi:MAG: ETEC_3214 domain-containing protein [Patescibacteria group bacterium]
MKKIFSFTFKLIVILLLFLIYLKVSTPVKQEKNILTKEEKYINLSKVSISVQVDYLKKYLGKPVSMSTIKDKNQKEYIFVDPDYYVMLTTNLDNSVLSYVITTRSKNFNPILRIRGIKVQLGKSTFYEKGVKPDDCESHLGNTAPSYYFEIYLGDNQSSYQSYLFGYNDAGLGDIGIVWASQPNESEIKKNNFKLTEGMKCRLPSDQDRKKYTINTFGVGSLDTLSIGVNRRLIERVN